MECIEARALKSSFLSQMTMKTNSPMFYNDDVWCLTGINNVASDDFPVEELLNLDFPEKDFQEGFGFSQEDEIPQKESSNISSSTFSGADEIDSLSELAVPVDDLENLEWLSQFVDDSTSGLSLLCPAGSFKPGANSANRVELVNGPPQVIRAPYFHVPVPGKARSKRSRKSSGRSWSLASSPLASGDSTSTPSSSYGSSNLSPFVFMNPVHNVEWLSSAEKPAAKKQKRKPEGDSGSGRKCMHCQVQKTPQWRTGPLGPKTLCNACGVRYKSGRLFPEYRPAFSPTFSQELHSNSHRKVLEMRRKKETAEIVEIGRMVEPGFAQAVQSY
ncbi:gata transcription factor 9 [Phtheirospermum japonicum]|uniref:GATA transcription factor n=1 Tax=Phtheirospermum japonicum TaxID=374723 RepID=A0A830BV17_9LAMI|nr:gata transcription factor 9 [Phtheirospermum japonicum]